MTTSMIKKHGMIFTGHTLSDGTVVTAEQELAISEAQPDYLYRPTRYEGHQAADGSWFPISPRGTFPYLPSGNRFGSRDEVQAAVELWNSSTS